MKTILSSEKTTKQTIVVFPNNKHFVVVFSLIGLMHELCRFIGILKAETSAFRVLKNPRLASWISRRDSGMQFSGSFRSPSKRRHLNKKHKSGRILDSGERQLVINAYVELWFTKPSFTIDKVCKVQTARCRCRDRP